MVQSVMEEKATTSANKYAASYSTSGMEVTTSREISTSPSATSADTAGKSAAGPEVVAERGISPLAAEERAIASADKSPQSTADVEDLITRGILTSAAEERATTSADTASQSTPGMEVVTARGISPQVTEERLTTSAHRERSLFMVGWGGGGELEGGGAKFCDLLS